MYTADLIVLWFVVFPAGILQPPFYHENYPKYVGWIIRFCSTHISTQCQKSRHTDCSVRVRLYVHCTALRYICLSVCLSVVCLWRCCTVGTNLNLSTIFLHRPIAQGLGQFVLKLWAKIPRGSGGLWKIKYKRYEKFAFFDQHLA